MSSHRVYVVINNTSMESGIEESTHLSGGRGRGWLDIQGGDYTRFQRVPRKKRDIPVKGNEG